MTPLQAEYRRRAALDTDMRCQMPVLYAWARQAAKVIELGVRSGNSTCALLAGLEHGGGELWSVDEKPPVVPAWWHDLPSWHLLVANDTWPGSPGFCPDGADVLFIDTSHLYAHTRMELLRYGPKVRPGGVILLHDTDTGEWPGVSQALDDWCGHAGMAWYDHPGSHGLGVVEIPDGRER